MRWASAIVFMALASFATDALAITRAEAWQACFTYEANWEATKGAAYGSCSEMGGSTDTTGTVQYKRASDGGALASYNYGSGCPAGQIWQTSTHTCFDSAACLAKSQLGASFFTKSGSGATCVDGCQFRPDVSVCGTWPGKGTVCAVGGAKPTGQPCSNEPAPQTDGCTPASGGQTFCIKPDGQHCYTASTGRVMCWAAGQTGTQTDGPIAQKRDAGTQPIAPNTQLPSGDTLVTTGNPQTTTSTVTNNTTNSTQNITTVVQNYQTQNGTSAGGGAPGTDTGQNADGSGSGSGSGEGNGNGASGGTNCETPPIVTGDAALGMVATQTWATRCATEAGNAAKVTGNIEDCAQAFTVEGTNANAVKLRAMRAQLCKGDANGDGRPDWTDTDGTEKGDGDEAHDAEPGLLGITLGADLLDTSGFLGTGQCPSFGTIDLVFAQVNIDSLPYFCDLLPIARAALIMLGLFIGMRMLFGDVW